jgi:DNA-binding NtrC family response regulator
VVAATNRDLLDEIDEGRFREDLYYRLNVIPIFLPPLRERREDIPALAEFFVQKYAQANHRPVPAIAPESSAALQGYAWPGNVRELQNYIERSIVLCAGQTLSPELFPAHMRGLTPVRIARHGPKNIEALCSDLVASGMAGVDDSTSNLHERIVSLVEKELIQQVLKSCQGVQTKAATRLGINRNTLHKKISEYALEAEPE